METYLRNTQWRLGKTRLALGRTWQLDSSPWAKCQMETIGFITLDRSTEIEWLVDRKRDLHLLKIKSKELVEVRNSISLTKILHTVLLNSNLKQTHKNNLCLLVSITALQSSIISIQINTINSSSPQLKRRLHHQTTANWPLHSQQSLHQFWIIIALHSKFHKLGKALKTGPLHCSRANNNNNNFHSPTTAAIHIILEPTIAI